ncbi:prepilin-type N-terminal cleavage/methylation domain-containing protein [Dyella sp. A6]|uniref:prepilin-type N-terminal cleavage/methylation domain-containing protein n=1 Tax=Dyella aluminiiresistens TaxID=3069105 RepID=UPI002E763461|nr:prepilin-type N-terminal cleavage/methylation domain-containing protein [Dyella sp. A6]
MTRASCRGFTLLEVIVAILLLAVAFAALMRVAGGAIGLTQRSIAHEQAAMWARSLLDSRFALSPPRPGITQGRFGDGYRWRLQVTPWTPPGAPPPTGMLRLYRLDLDVLWGSAARPQQAHFSTLQSAFVTPGAPVP